MIFRKPYRAAPSVREAKTGAVRFDLTPPLAAAAASGRLSAFVLAEPPDDPDAWFRLEPGARVALAEPWSVAESFDGVAPARLPLEARDGLAHRAALDPFELHRLGPRLWRAPRVAPSWAVRLTLEVAEVYRLRAHDAADDADLAARLGVQALVPAATPIEAEPGALDGPFWSAPHQPEGPFYATRAAAVAALWHALHGHTGPACWRANRRAAAIVGRVCLTATQEPQP